MTTSRLCCFLGCCFLVSVSAVQAAELARWTLDDGSGDLALSSVNSPAADALFVGDPEWVSSLLPPVAANSSALHFHEDPGVPIAAFLESRTLAGVAADGARSISAWVRTLSSEGQVIVDSGEQAAGRRFTFRLNDNPDQGTQGAVRLEVNGGYAVGITPVDDGQWHHIAVTFPAGGSVDDAAFYVDGNLDADLATLPFSGALDSAVDTASTLIQIGRRIDDASYYSGSVDQVQYWDTQLSPSEVGQLVPAGQLPAIAFVVDRDSGSIVLDNGYGVPISGIVGYSIRSAAEALSVAGWTSVANNHDANSGGGSPFDSDDAWTLLTDVATPSGGDLSEFAASGDGGVLSTTAPLDLGNAWVAGPFEDLRAEVIFSNGDRLPIAVDFIGNNNTPFEMGDIDLDGQVDEADWGVFRSHLFSTFEDIPAAQSYLMGDLDLDGDNDRFDFEMFEGFYDDAQGAGAFQQLLQGAPVPEPSAFGGIFTLIAVWGAVFWRGMRIEYKPAVVVLRSRTRPFMLLLCSLAVCTSARADLVAYYDFDLPSPYLDRSLNGADGGVTAATTVTQSPGLLGEALLALDGLDATANGRVSVPQALAPDFGTGDLSYSLWYKRAPQTETGSSDGLLDSLNGTTSGIQLMIQNGGIVNGRFDTVDAGFITINSPANAVEADTAAPETFQWHHIAFSIDRTSANPSASLYVDGQSVGSVNGSINDIIGGNISPTQDLYLGQGNTQLAGGFLDDVAFFDSALTQQEVSSLFNQTSSPTDFLERLSIQVNMTSGLVTLGVSGPSAVPFDYYEISSPSGSLNQSTWSSLQSRGLPGFPAGTGIGDGWEEAGGSNDIILGETFLQGQSSVDPQEPGVGLGNLWRTAGQQDISLVYRDAATGAFKQGIVEYVTGPALPGDFNADGVVDAIDYAVWRESLGQSLTLPNEDTTPGVVTQEDYLTWRSNYGATSLSPQATHVVPAPHSAAALLMGIVVLVALTRACRLRIVACGVLLLASSSSFAERTADRIYRFGDDPFEVGQIGTLVVDNTNTSGFTFDSIGDDNTTSTVAGEFIDIEAHGGVLYAEGKDQGTVAVQFDGDGDYIRGRRLGLPSTSAGSATAILTSEVTQAGPFDYSGIANRGFQMWVKPIAVGGGLQAVIRDTAQHAVAIDADGSWVMQYGGLEYDSGEAAIAGEWSHVMLVRPYGGSELGGARLYVNGEAVGAIGRGYAGNDDSNLVIGASLDAEGLPADFFTGLVDELEMFVLGTSATERVRYGVFDPGVDNDFIASQLTGVAGDITLDGVLGPDDVADFVTGWLSEHRVNGVQVGDINSYRAGDLNFNGVVDIDDAVLMNNATIGAGLGSIFLALNESPAPEPMAFCLVVHAGAMTLLCRQRKSS